MPCMPAGIACLPPLLDEHEIEVLDLFWEENPEQALRNTIRDIQPGLVGFSIRNVDNQLWSRPDYYFPEVKRYVEVARAETSSPIVVGGAAYSIFPYSALHYFGADWGIAGDGEVSFPPLVQALENCCDPSGIEGVVSPDDSGKRFTPPRVKDYDQIPPPAWETIDTERYVKEGSALSMLSRRGCPYNCIYCDAPPSEGHVVRGKSPKRLVDEIESAVRAGVTTFFVADNVFNHPPGYAGAVAEEIIRRKIKITWGATLHPRGIDTDEIRLLRRSGFILSSIGPDSGSPQMLKNYRKGCSIEEVKRLISLLKENEIRFFMSILLGGPGETRSTVEESVKFAENAGATVTSVRVGIRITPLTGLHKVALDEGVLDPDDNLMEPRFYVSSDISDWIFDYLNANLKGVPGIIVQ